MIKTAIIDSGIETCENGVTIFENENGEIAYLDNGYDFDVLTHGDVVAQTIGKENVEMFSVKIFHTELYTTSKVLCAAIQWCIDKNVKIINISAGLKYTNEEEVEALRAICENAYDQGIIIITAYDNEYSYPAQFDTVIAVQKDSNLKSNQYQVDERMIWANGEVEYICPSKKSRGGLNGSSFACARVTRLISKLLVENPNLSCQDIIEVLIANQSVGLQSSIDQSKIGVSGLLFLNNANDVYLRQPEILNYNIQYLYVSDVFYGNKEKYESQYSIIYFNLDDIMNDCKNLKEVFKFVDTVIISRMDFLKKNITDWQTKLEKFIVELAYCEKNVVCLENVSEQALEEISMAFSKNNKVICFAGEIRSDKNMNTDVNIDNISKTLLLTVSRTNDGALLECFVKEKEGTQCAILSTNFNSKLIGSSIVRRLYENEYYSHRMKKRFIDANIRYSVGLSPVINHVHLSLNFPMIQYGRTDDRNEEYDRFLSMVLAFETDDIIIIANQQDEASEVVAAVNMIELLTAKKVSAIMISNTAYCEGDDGEYTRYACIPSDYLKAKARIKEIHKLIPDVEIIEL